MEWNLNYEREDDCYAKLVTHRGEGGRVVGFHYLGPHAGEVTQGFGALMLKGATKEDFDRTVGIHPTAAEVTFMYILRNSPYSLLLQAHQEKGKLDAEDEKCSITEL